MDGWKDGWKARLGSSHCRRWSDPNEMLVTRQNRWMGGSMDGRPRPRVPLLSSPVLSCLGGMDGWICLLPLKSTQTPLSLSLASVKPHNNNNNTPPQQQQRDDRAIGRTVDMTNHTDAPRTNRNVEQAQTKRKKFGFQTPNANHKSVPHRTILYKSIQFRILYSIRWTLVSTVHENHEAIEAVAI